MRILVTNDDGITAPGLVVAEAIAAHLAGPEGEVWTIAPAFEQSGVGHCISYVRPMRIEQMAERRFAVEGSPADCVMAGLFDIMKDAAPDLVLSGVNRGHNVAEDTLYSGTIGAAMEAALHKTRTIAMSQYYGPPDQGPADPFEAARVHGPGIAQRLWDHAKWEQDGRYGVFYNVNFPFCAADDVKAVKATAQGERGGSPFGGKVQVAPNGRRYMWITHGMGNHTCAPGTDAREASEGNITVTPLRADLTARDMISDLDILLNKDA
ncbi:5'-nucleotidase [Rubricella aquisinus]|uniref:5'-nucleotidase SurE n=1 Tax=Rubricella aquisinus TaxID=2028108 RepID=A0A840WQT1_9RHOB|nr:5'/3'-nucleotidase SurE [Rubricella aquisinus]MBB5516403.1 5'-nucleotidase [Rubricella aquisinus]